MSSRGVATEAEHRKSALSLLALHNSIDLERIGLRLPKALPLAVWEKIGHQLIAISDSSAWWIADWLVYGETAYQDRYRDAIKKTSLDYQTLRNYAWVARRFELSRRRDRLSFAHHAEVAALTPPEQEFWLRKAEEFAWSRNQLRREVRDSLKVRQSCSGADGKGPPLDLAPGAGAGDPPGITSRTEVVVMLRLKREQLAACLSQANDSGLGLEDWVVRILTAAAPLAPGNSTGPARERNGRHPHTIRSPTRRVHR